MIKAKIILILMLISSLTVSAQTKQTVQTGKASFYSKRATGSRTASGDKLHHDSLTCAHRTYPFGTLLKVRNLANGKEVVVKVTDRGPHSRGRIIDLSYSAADSLGLLSKGVGMVEVRIYNPQKVPYKPNDYDMPEMDFVDNTYVPDMETKRDATKTLPLDKLKINLAQDKLKTNKENNNEKKTNSNRGSRTVVRHKHK